jgi:hypothetical protein
VTVCLTEKLIFTKIEMAPNWSSSQLQPHMVQIAMNVLSVLRSSV